MSAPHVPQTGKQVQPEDLGPRARPRDNFRHAKKTDRRGSLSKNLQRVFGKTAVNALQGVEERKNNTGFEYVHTHTTHARATRHASTTWDCPPPPQARVQRTCPRRRAPPRA